MKNMGPHANIVTMFACTTRQLPLCMVMEHVPYGDLKHYLHNLRRQLESYRADLQRSFDRDYVLSSPLPPIQQQLPPITLANCEEQMDEDRLSNLVDEYIDVDNSLCGPDDPGALTYTLDAAELASFSVQIAAGMAHVEAIGVTHRDLAARNILVA